MGLEISPDGCESETFPQFCLLPPELQLRVWELAIPPRRVINLARPCSDDLISCTPEIFPCSPSCDHGKQDCFKHSDKENDLEADRWGYRTEYCDHGMYHCKEQHVDILKSHKPSSSVCEHYHRCDHTRCYTKVHTYASYTKKLSQVCKQSQYVVEDCVGPIHGVSITGHVEMRIYFYPSLDLIYTGDIQVGTFNLWKKKYPRKMVIASDYRMWSKLHIPTVDLDQAAKTLMEETALQRLVITIDRRVMEDAEARRIQEAVTNGFKEQQPLTKTPSQTFVPNISVVKFDELPALWCQGSF